MLNKWCSTWSEWVRFRLRLFNLRVIGLGWHIMRWNLSPGMSSGDKRPGNVLWNQLSPALWKDSLYFSDLTPSNSCGCSWTFSVTSKMYYTESHVLYIRNIPLCSSLDDGVTGHVLIDLVVLQMKSTGPKIGQHHLQKWWARKLMSLNESWYRWSQQTWQTQQLLKWTESCGLMLYISNIYTISHGFMKIGTARQRSSQHGSYGAPHILIKKYSETCCCICFWNKCLFFFQMLMIDLDL